MANERAIEEQQEEVATKSDIRRLEARMATKEDLAHVEKSIRADMATKEDLARMEKSIRADMATKEDLNRVEKNIRSDMATKDMFYSLVSQLNQLRDDIAPIKDSHTTNAAIREADLIAEEMGFEFSRIMEREDLRRLVSGKNPHGASSDDMKSFRRADLIIEVSDSSGEASYITAEVSFTADLRDIERAARNAKYLSELTGKQTRAAIIGLRRDNRIRRIPQSEVFWYALPQSALHSE